MAVTVDKPAVAKPSIRSRVAKVLAGAGVLAAVVAVLIYVNGLRKSAADAAATRATDQATIVTLREANQSYADQVRRAEETRVANEATIARLFDFNSRNDALVEDRRSAIRELGRHDPEARAYFDMPIPDDVVGLLQQQYGDAPADGVRPPAG